MLLKIGSLLLVLIITGYCILHFNRNKDNIFRSIGTVTTLLTGFSTATVGFLLMQTSNYNLTLTIIICFLVAIVCGFLVGGPFQKVKGLNELLSGFIGASIGSTLGFLTFISITPFLIVDILFVLFIYFLLKLFDKQIVMEQNKKLSNKGKKKLSHASTIILSSTFGILLLIIFLNFNHFHVGIIGQPQKQNAVMDEENDLQVATINVTPSGFDPKNTILKANTMIKVNFIVDIQEGKQVTLVSNDLKLNIGLKKGNNMVLLDNPQIGQYHLMLEPGKSEGLLTVKASK
ncbi:hypothetical protein ACFVSW_04350 [Neobacillus sp. NPDC058068]|uniref:hypothetical protein n=1 Tax=Neobacillus sp. NPDC058068 TaxID=3346325 RepID=UPI0036DC1C67